jgi:orotidine-5'-phosphate decarboxylase
MDNFADRLLNAIDEKQNPSCVGLDPRIGMMPDYIKKAAVIEHGPTLQAVAAAFLAFNKNIINGIHDIVPGVKPQMAFYECYGAPGVQCFHDTVNYARDAGLLVIEDAKRNDIGSTSTAYADGHLGRVQLLDGSMVPVFDVDAMTVNGYLGSDG